MFNSFVSIKGCPTWTGRREVATRGALGSTPAGQHVQDITAGLGPAKAFLSSPRPGNNKEKKIHSK